MDLVIKQSFVAELTVPLGNKGDVYIAVGQGHNKAEAERACCTAACEKLHQLGLLQKPNEKVASPSSNAVPPTSIKKAVEIQQVSFSLISQSFELIKLFYLARYFLRVYFAGSMKQKLDLLESHFIERCTLKWTRICKCIYEIPTQYKRSSTWRDLYLAWINA